MAGPMSGKYQYELDNDDKIIEVDGWWLAFAQENGIPELTASMVVGHSIWEFIAGEPTQSLYRVLHDRVRATGRPISVPFRCDSPTLQRYMQLTIHTEPQGHLLYESTLIRTQPQRYMRLLSPQFPRSSESLTMCSFCKRSLIEPSDWLDLENISLKLRLFDQQTVPELRYTVCPQCANLGNLTQHTSHQTRI
jgi:hypothetical protein